MKMLEYAAWFMIWLIIMLPVAFAQQMTVQKFSGTDNVEGFARENDELTIQVLAQMAGSPTNEVARQRARVHYDNTYFFMDSCTSQAGGMYQCNYKTTDLIYGGKDNYAIKLFDTENKEIASINKTLTVDILPPRIISFSLSPNTSNAPKPTTVVLKAEDYGYEAGKTTDCSGIKLINISANGTTVGQITTSIGTCTKNSTFTFTPTIQGQSGRIKVCAVATDYLNHKSLPVCKDILIDSRKPTPEALELRDQEGFEITHARTGQTILADVFVKIPDIDINPTAVYADLSKLNPTLGKKPKDDKSHDWFIWRKVPITTPSTCQVTVNATDLMGNKDTKTLTCTIGIDDTAPEPLSLSTQFVDDDGKPVLGVTGTIIAEFKEAGSGMSKGNAYFDLHSLGLGAETKASKCEKTGTENWKCYWKVIPTVSSGRYSVKLLPTTRDNLNNQVTKTLQMNVTFDKTAPENPRLVEIAAFREQQRVKTNYTSLGETLEFVVEATGFKTALADLSDLGGSNETLPERCEGNLTKKCVFSIDVGVSGPQETRLKFSFADVAGNKAEITTSELFILGISNETAPNYWTITSECSPKLLDRTTLSVFEHPVYCRIKMESPNTNAFPLTVEGPADLSECTGQTDYISEFSIENNYAGSTEPYIVMTLVATDYTINNLNFTCPLKTLTRIGKFIPQNLEHDNITINLQFYNLPLGELYNNIDSDVEDVNDKVEGAWKIIRQLQKFMSTAEKLCTILNAVMNVISLLAMISLISDTIGNILYNIPGLQGVAEAMKEEGRMSCRSAEKSRTYFNKEGGLLTTFKKFCDFTTCQAGLFDFLSNEGFMGEIRLDVMSAQTAGKAKAGMSNWYYDWASLGNKWTKEQLAGAIAKEGTAVQNPNVYLNVKDSLIYSIIIPPLCIPGIIYNLDKWKQIECRYGLCLLEDVREQGMPASVCKDQKNYMQCRFVVGEIFNIIPFAPIVSYYLNLIQQAFSNPIALVSAALAIACASACEAGGTMYYVCAGTSIAAQLGETINYIKNFKSLTDFGSISNQWCDQFTDTFENYKAQRTT
ncbi:MAG: hypothetical protein QXR48_01330 [Candidatus Woesearchaeota archaeon]